MKKCLLLAGLFACAAELLAAQFTLFDKNGTAQKGIIQNFTLIKNAAKSKKSFNSFLERVKTDTGKVKNRDPETERICRQFLSDMHFEKGTFPERIAHISKQSANFENAVAEIEKSLPSLQEPSRKFLRTNLLSHALIMRACSDIYKHSTSQSSRSQNATAPPRRLSLTRPWRHSDTSTAQRKSTPRAGGKTGTGAS